MAILAAESQLRGELVTDGVTEQEGDGAASLLVEGDLESTGNSVLAGVHVPGKEDGETLSVARRARFAEDLDDFGVREPFGDGSTGAQAVAQLGTGDIQGLDARGYLVLGLVLIGVGQVGDLLELDDLDAELLPVLLDSVLSIVRAVEFLALGVLAGTSMVTSDDEVSGTVVLTDDGVPDGLTGTTHTHGEAQKAQDGHSVGVAGEESLVGADTGEVVDVSRLGETDNGVNQDIGLASASSTDGQLTVSSVHGVSSLESNNSVPAELVEVNTQLRGSVAESDIVVVVELVDGLNLSSDVEFLNLVVEILDGRVLLITAKDQLGFLGLVRAVDIVNGEDGQIAIVSEVSQGDAGAGLELAFIDNGLGHVQGDGHGEEVAVGETDIFANTVIVLLVHETLQRTETTVHNQFEITKLTFGEDNGRQLLGLHLQLVVAWSITGEQVLENTTMRRIGHFVYVKRKDTGNFFGGKLYRR